MTWFWTTNCLSVAFSRAVAILQPPIEGTRENFPSDCGDPDPIHSPSCKQIFVTYIPDICHRLRRQDHLMLIWLRQDRQSSYPGSKYVRLCEAVKVSWKKAAVLLDFVQIPPPPHLDKIQKNDFFRENIPQIPQSWENYRNSFR